MSVDEAQNTPCYDIAVAVKADLTEVYPPYWMAITSISQAWHSGHRANSAKKQTDGLRVIAVNICNDDRPNLYGISEVTSSRVRRAMIPPC